VSFPPIRYGNFYKSGLGLFTKWSYQLASHLSPKHYSLFDYDYRYDASIPQKQGIKNFVPGINKPLTVITNGYDDTKFYRSSEKIKNSFITVSGGFEYPFQVALKGIDLILQAAERFPECSFTIVGVPEWKKLDVRSNNVKLLPPVKNSELQPLYSKHQFYLQLSMAEGFPNALCEAMLCECVPIVSNVFSMSEIVADAGFILEHRKIDELISLLNSAINNQQHSDKSILARKLISENYPLSLRTEKLKKLVLSLIN
jgi:glycosyltransferase involved in cell wall biosynthesis